MSPAAVLSILVQANTAQATAALSRVDAQAKKTTGSMNAAGTAAGGKFAKGAKTATLAAAALGAYGLYKAVSAGAEFEKQMDSLGAVTEASGRQMGKLEKQALKLGQATVFSANEVAAAQTNLAKGGLTVKQILGGGLRAALGLAAAGELDLADAAATTVNAMKLFGLKGKDAMKVADMLATAANKTTADVSDFALALRQGGGVAKLAGMNFRETVTVLEALAEAGYKSSDAGTSLKSFFINIGTPSEKAKKMMEELGLSIFKANGELKSLPQISANLRDAFGELTQAQFLEQAGTVAGSDAIRTLYALYDAGPKKLRALERANKETGTAQEIARKKMDNLSGDAEELGGALETLGIKVSKLLNPALRFATQWLTRLVNKVGNFSLRSLQQELGLSNRDLHKFGEAAKNVADFWRKYFAPVIKDQIKGAIQALRGFFQVVKGIVQLISGILTGDFGQAWKGVKNIFGGAIKFVLGNLRAATAPFRAAAEAVGGGLKKGFNAAWGKIKGVFEDGRDAIIDVINAIIDVINIIPGVPDIGKIGGGGGDGGSGKGKGKGSKSVGRHFSGGAITKPMAIVGEEAPRHHEWVIATNPAYKRDNLRYWAKAGADLGVPGFATGGVIGKAAGAVADVAGKGAGFFIDKLPKPDIPEPFNALGPYLIAQVSDWIKNGFDTKKFGSLRLGTGTFSYTGPPANMKQLGDNRWVDSHTLAVGAYLAKKFGVEITDGWRPQNASYGAANSSHKRGTPSNPGALDFAPPSRGLQGFVGQHVAGILENEIHDWGSGLHNHVAFFRKGGLLKLLAEGGRNDGRQSLMATASTAGKLVGASTYGGPADSTSGTVGAAGVSLPGKMAFAELDMGKALGGLPFGAKLKISRAGRSVIGEKLDIGAGGGPVNGLHRAIDLWHETANVLGLPDSWLGTVRVTPAGGSSTRELSEGEQKRREAESRKRTREAQLVKLRQAVADAKSTPAKVSKLWKLIKFWGRAGIFDKEEKGHLLGSVQKAASQTSPEGTAKVLSHLASWANRAGEITGRDPEDGASLTDAIQRAQERGKKARDRIVERNKRRRDRKIGRIAARGNFPELTKALEAHEGAYEIANQGAERLVALEPEDLSDSYVDQERGAWGGVLGTLAAWRDKVITSRDFAASSIPAWQEQIEKIKALQKDHPEAFKKQRWRIKPLREAIANAQTFIAGRGEELTGLQGVGGPQGVLGALGEGTPHWLALGGPGARIFDTQNTIRELAIKVGGGQTVIGGDGAGDAERIAALEEMLREANLRNLVFERQKPIIDAYTQKNFAGMFAKGGNIPAGMWGIVGERGPEPVFGPATVVGSDNAPGAFGPASIRVEVFDHTTKVYVNDQEVEAVVKRMQRDQGRKAKTIGSRKAGRGV